MVLRAYSRLFAQGLMTLGGFGVSEIKPGLYGVSEIKPGSATCKANGVLAVGPFCSSQILRF